ncbi:MAG: hypothetical protein SFX73_07020 [Kofleriaceae bacterium]|nr:hypothetical protein [Kofleriaceae bacterium]
MQRFAWIAWLCLAALGACGGSVVYPAQPRAELYCTDCLDGPAYALGSKLKVSATWEASCEDANPRIGVEGRRDGIVPCRRQDFTTAITCSDPAACEIDVAAETITFVKPGPYTVDIAFKRVGARDGSVKLPVEAAAPVKATTRCISFSGSTLVVEVALLSAAGKRLTGSADVTVANGACKPSTNGAAVGHFDCQVPVLVPAPPPELRVPARYEAVVRSGAFTQTQTVECSQES